MASIQTHTQANVNSCFPVLRLYFVCLKGLNFIAGLLRLGGTGCLADNCSLLHYSGERKALHSDQFCPQRLPKAQKRRDSVGAVVFFPEITGQNNFVWSQQS